MSSSGLVKTKNFGRWIQRQRQKEEYLLSRGDTMKKKTTKSKNAGSQDPTGTRTNAGNPVAGWFAEDRIDLPSNRDVLLGTGKPLMKHPGNQNFRMIVDNLLQVYDTTPSLRDKAEVTWRVVRYIQENQGGRFLKRDSDSDWWQVVNNQEARDKTGKAFVNQRESRKAKGFSSSTTSNVTRPARIDTPITMGLREDSPSTDDKPRSDIPQTREAMVWGSTGLQIPRNAETSTTITIPNNTGPNKRPRHDGGGGGSTSTSNSCFAWCGGGGGTTSTTVTSSSTSILDRTSA